MSHNRPCSLEFCCFEHPKINFQINLVLIDQDLPESRYRSKYLLSSIECFEVVKVMLCDRHEFARCLFNEIFRFGLFLLVRPLGTGQ